MAFKQEAHGSFSVHVLGENHCGPDHNSPKSFPFSVCIEYPVEALDARGFLLDNLHFRSYFDGIGQTDLSCELLARKCADDLFRATGGRCIKVTVSIWGIPDHACISFTKEGEN